MMPSADASGQLLDDLRALVERHGADEIVLRLDPIIHEWVCSWGYRDERFGREYDADLAAAVHRLRVEADRFAAPAPALYAAEHPDAAR